MKDVDAGERDAKGIVFRFSEDISRQTRTRTRAIKDFFRHHCGAKDNLTRYAYFRQEEGETEKVASTVMIRRAERSGSSMKPCGRFTSTNMADSQGGRRRGGDLALFSEATLLPDGKPSTSKVDSYQGYNKVGIPITAPLVNGTATGGSPPIHHSLHVTDRTVHFTHEGAFAEVTT